MKRFMKFLLSVFMICSFLLLTETVTAEDDILESSNEAVETNDTEPDELSDKGNAYAILTEDNEFLFFRSEEQYDNRTQHTVTINAKDYTGIVYSGIETSSMPWQSAHLRNIESVKVADGYVIRPVSMTQWFLGCQNLKSFDATGIDTSRVTSMYCTFSSCSSLTALDLRGFDTSNVTSMYDMFDCCSSLVSLDLSSFDTSKVTDMSGMFSNCSSLTSLDLHNFDTSNVIKMAHMFSGCSSLTSLALDHFNTENVTTFFLMFYDCSSLRSLDLRNFITSKVTSMDSMFKSCTSLIDVDLSSFDTSMVTGMSGMFANCPSLRTLDLGGFNNSNVTNMNDMFYNCTNLGSVILGSGFTKWNHDSYLPSGTWINKDKGISKTETELYEQYPSNAEMWAGLWTRDLSSVGSAYEIVTEENDLIFFRSIEQYKNGTRYSVEINGVVYTGNVYTGFESGSVSGNESDWNKIETVRVADGYVIKPDHLGSWFSGCKNLKSFDGTGFDLTNVESMSYMFFNCSSLVSLDLSSFDTSGVTYMSNMFSGCSALREVTLGSNWNQWTNSAYLPAGIWRNEELNIKKTEKELYDEYPSHASEWAGTWTRAFTTSISIDAEYLVMYIGDIVELSYTAEPEDAALNPFWQIFSNPSIATVDQKGTFTAISPGITTVRVYANDGSQLYDDCVIVILDVPYIRVRDENRLTESIKVADQLKRVNKTWLDSGHFSTIIVAKDSNFADALSGSYLATQKGAPILLVNDSNHKEAYEYIYENLFSLGTVYILGGPEAVAASFEENLGGEYAVRRLAGSSRYLTNLAILKEAGMTSSGDIIVVTGEDYADSLSAGAIGLPILMVNNRDTKLKNSQIDFLKRNVKGKIYILGQESAVNAKLEKALKTYGKVTRIGDSSRWGTTKRIAETFFKNPEYVVLATGNDFTDGLIASQLAYSLKSPLLLCASNKISWARSYVAAKSINKAYIIGLESGISDKAARDILGIDDSVVILER